MVMKWLRDTFTPIGIIAIGLLIGGTLVFLWFMWAVEQAAAKITPIRAITAVEHSECADMPHGGQVLVNKRKECFDGLYNQGRYRVSR